MRLIPVIVALVGVSACHQNTVSLFGAATTSKGTSTRVATPALLPDGHPDVLSLGGTTTTTSATSPAAAIPTGRAPRRMTVDQLEAALTQATGFGWRGDRVVTDVSCDTGRCYKTDLDLYQVFAQTLGRADYRYQVADNNLPSVPFSKLAGDAIRTTCMKSVAADVAEPSASKRRLLGLVDPKDTVAANPQGVRANVVAMVQRFWGDAIAPSDPDIDALVTIFQNASTSAAGKDQNGVVRGKGTISEGWTLVCIALASDSQFLTY